MIKDIIFQKQNHKNPMCRMSDGKIKPYKQIFSRDKPFIFEENIGFIVGEVLETKYANEHWIYRIQTPQSEGWREPIDFIDPKERKNVHIQTE